MSLLKEFADKYKGVFYSEHHPIQKGKINYKGTEIELLWHGLESDPLRILTTTSESLEGNLMIYPKSYSGQLFSRFLPNWKFSFSQNIHSQYKFSGKNHFIQSIRDNQSILDLLAKEKVCIVLKKKQR